MQLSYRWRHYQWGDRKRRWQRLNWDLGVSSIHKIIYVAHEFCQHLLESIVSFNLKRDEKTLLWSSNRCLKMKYIFLELLTNHTEGDAFIFSYSKPANPDTNRIQTVNQRRNNMGNFYFLSASFFSPCLIPDFDRRGRREKKWVYCQRQSFLLSERFPSMLNRWRTKITSISTKRTYQSINAPVASFLATSQQFPKLQKNHRKQHGTASKMATPAKLVSKYGQTTWKTGSVWACA